MRAMAVSVWIFINLVFFGMCGYIYLLWSQYWHYITRQQQNLAQAQVQKIDNRPLVDYYQEQMPMEILHMQRQAMLNMLTTPPNYRRMNKPRFKSSSQRRPPAICENCNEEEIKRVTAFKNRLIIRFRSVLHDESSVFRYRYENPYNVNYVGLQQSISIPAHKLLCRLQKYVPTMPTITGTENAFWRTPIRKLTPKQPILETDEQYNNCAIVSNSGALLNSSLGSFIDSHDFVLRFNHAPTEGYEKDVGSKTTMRILNSQVISKKKFKFLESKMYENIKLLAWDPCNYTSTLSQWRDRPDFDVFTPYVKHRKLKPNTNFHLADPRYLWKLWNFLQSHTPVRIRRNPPSSGFLGLALLLPHCNRVRLFEFIPSMRLTSKCHYFDQEVDSSCTFGVWHPLAAEKLIALALNEENDYTTFDIGYISVAEHEFHDLPLREWDCKTPIWYGVHEK